MPWKETTIVNERMKLISDHLSDGYSVSELARRYGVSRKAVYKWIERHEQEGVAGLEDRSRAPHSHPQAVDAEIVRRILALKERWPTWGAPKLLVRLKAQMRERCCPAESTVSEILRRHGLSFAAKRRSHAVPSTAPLGHCQGPNEVWCADFKGWFRTAEGSKCTPLTISDAYSRYLLRCHGLGEASDTAMVQPIFLSAFREYGLPRAIRTDNGTPFASRGLGGLTRLNVWWVRLGIFLERIEPGKPQQNGRHERLHRTLRESVINPPQGSLRQQQLAFERFGYEYNYERPHEALGQRAPAEFYTSSSREYPSRLPEPRAYPDEWERRTVCKAGRMRWHCHRVDITRALWGQQIGLEPKEDGRWRVWFEHMELGDFDERRLRVLPLKRLRPAEEPKPFQELPCDPPA
jgi:putative transposase